MAIPLGILLVVLTASFIYGWFYDSSKPVAGIGWADQTLYKETVDTLLSGHLPTAHQLHYAVGYPLLGVIGGLFIPSQPFLLISYLLLMGSALFCYFAVKKLMGVFWALLFCGLLFLWDGIGRTLYTASELFVIPWNNQVLFFAISFFFWLYVTQLKKSVSHRTVIITAFISGLTLLTREESALFVLPLLVFFLSYNKVSKKMWLISFLIMAVMYTPQLIAKQNALGSIFASGRSFSYGSAISKHYLQPEMLYRNTWEVLIDSERLINKPPNPVIQEWCDELPEGACAPSEATIKPALLESMPWLWLGFMGMAYVLISKRYSIGLKVFILITAVGVLVFYLSGSNMAWQKLQYHCLRYISPSFIALNLGVVVALNQLWSVLANTVQSKQKGNHKPGSQ